MMNTKYFDKLYKSKININNMDYNKMSLQKMFNKTKVLKKKERMLKKEKKLNQTKILNNTKTKPNYYASIRNDLLITLIAIFTFTTFVCGSAALYKAVSMAFAMLDQPVPTPAEMIALYNKIREHFPNLADEIFKSNKMTAIFIIYISHLEVLMEYARAYGYTPEAAPKLHGLTQLHLQDWAYRLNCWQHSLFYNVTLDFLNYYDKNQVMGVYEHIATRSTESRPSEGPGGLVGLRQSDFEKYAGQGNLYPMLRREEATSLTEFQWNEFNSSRLKHRKARYAAFKGIFIYPNAKLLSYSVFENMPSLITHEMSKVDGFAYLETDYEFIKGTGIMLPEAKIVVNS